MAIFSNLVENIMEVFMDDFSIFGCSFKDCLQNLGVVLCKGTKKHLVLN